MYRHTQPGWVVLLSLGGGALMMLALACIEPGPQGPLTFVIALLAVCAYVFSGLTVTVGEGHVVAGFGPGLIRRRVPLSEIASCSVVRNRWYYGWGIRKVPRGWMFNVSGLGAVELVLKKGSIFRIGTDEPDVLARFIQARLPDGGAGGLSQPVGPRRS